MSDFMMIVECLFSNTWAMFTTIEYPGLGISIAAILVGVFLIGLAIRIFSFIFGFTMHATSTTNTFRRISRDDD